MALKHITFQLSATTELEVSSCVESLTEARLLFLGTSIHKADVGSFKAAEPFLALLLMLLLIGMVLPVCLCRTEMQCPEEGAGSPETGVKESCALPRWGWESRN